MVHFLCNCLHEYSNAYFFVGLCYKLCRRTCVRSEFNDAEPKAMFSICSTWLRRTNKALLLNKLNYIASNNNLYKTENSFFAQGLNQLLIKIRNLALNRMKLFLRDQAYFIIPVELFFFELLNLKAQILCILF